MTTKKERLPGYRSVKQPDGTWSVLLGTRVVAKGFWNRMAAQDHIASLMVNYIQGHKEK